LKTVQDEGKTVLQIRANEQAPFEAFRTGARTRAVLATRPGISHRLADRQERVLVKLYKGDGSTVGSGQYQQYHQRDFHGFAPLTSNSHVQQSLEGGVHPGVGPYAVLQFVEGQELAVLLEESTITSHQARQIIEDILLEIWIPLWTEGLRFKDCHPGNFVVTAQDRVVMTDTEQMRKDLDERLHRPSEWTQRDKHERAGLSRLPGLLQRIILGANRGLSKAGVLRDVKSALASTGLPDCLHHLGRGGARGTCVNGVSALLLQLRNMGLIA